MQRVILIFLTLTSITLSCSLETGQSNIAQIPVGISQDSEKTGTLHVNLKEQANKTTVPDVDLARKYFKISGTCSDGSSFSLSTDLSEFDIVDLPCGRWIISVEAVYKDGENFMQALPALI